MRLACGEVAELKQARDATMRLAKRLCIRERENNSRALVLHVRLLPPAGSPPPRDVLSVTALAQGLQLVAYSSATAVRIFASLAACPFSFVCRCSFFVARADPAMMKRRKSVSLIGALKLITPARALPSATMLSKVIFIGSGPFYSTRSTYFKSNFWFCQKKVENRICFLRCARISKIRRQRTIRAPSKIRYGNCFSMAVHRSRRPDRKLHICCRVRRGDGGASRCFSKILLTFLAKIYRR